MSPVSAVRRVLDFEMSTDADVIARSVDDPDAFAVLFDRHAVTIHGYLSRRVGPHIADDLTAETFLVALKKRSGYDSAQANARPWLYGIATNLLHRHHRQETRQYRALARTGLDPVTENNPEDERDGCPDGTTY